MNGAAFTVELRSHLPPREALLRVLDLRAHSRLIPLTVVTPAVAADELHAGFRFVARTGVGPVAFEDAMRVDEIRGASARIVKENRVILGTIHLQISPAPGGSLVHWHQQVRLPWLPRFLQRPAAGVLRVGYRRILLRLLDAR